MELLRRTRSLFHRALVSQLFSRMHQKDECLWNAVRLQLLFQVSDWLLLAGWYYSRVGGILKSRFTLRYATRHHMFSIKRMALAHPSRLDFKIHGRKRKKHELVYVKIEFRFGGIDNDMRIWNSSCKAFIKFYFRLILIIHLYRTIFQLGESLTLLQILSSLTPGEYWFKAILGLKGDSFVQPLEPEISYSSREIRTENSLICYKFCKIFLFQWVFKLDVIGQMAKHQSGASSFWEFGTSLGKDLWKINVPEIELFY